MGGTRIFVLQKKDLIRIGIFTLLGLALVILLLVLLVPRGRGAAPDEDQDQGRAVYNAGRFVPGTYVSTITLNNEPVEVRVRVCVDDILSIYLSGMDDIQRTFYPLIEPRMYDLAAEILQHQTANIRPQTDYPVTTGLLHEAVISALQMAYVGG